MADPVIPTGEIMDTVLGKVTEKIMPGLLVQCASENLRIVELNLKGSFNSKLLGVKTAARNWIDSGALADVAARSPSAWASHIMRIPAMNMRNYGPETLLSTAPKDNIFGNANRSTRDFNMYKANVCTGPDEGEIIREIVQENTVIPLEGKKKVLADGTTITWSGPNIGLIKPISGTELNAAAYVSMLGYRLAKDVPFLFYSSGYGRTHGAIDFTYDIAVNLKTYGNGAEAGTTAWSSDQYDRPWDPMRSIISCEQPGMKYITLFITSMGGLPIPSSKVGKVDSPSAPNTFGSGWLILGIPVIDDGNDTRVNLYRDDIKDADYLITTRDYRYSTSTGKDTLVSNVLPNWRNIAIITDSETYVTPDGPRAWSSMPTLNYGTASAEFGANFLMYLAPPVPAQHYLVNSSTKSSKTYTVGEGKVLTVDTYEVNVTLFCCKFGREWYADYYRTGFGLYKPRSSAIQKNILDKWNALEFTEFGMCVDRAMSSVSPKIVDDTDVARRYKKARRQACKDDDWDKQKYSSKLTNGELKAKISAKPIAKAFYSIDTYVQEPDFRREDLSNVTWKRFDAATYTRTVGNGTPESYPINDTTRDLIVVELTENAVLSGTMATLASDFKLTGEELQSLSNAMREGNSGYIKQQPDLVGYVLKEQYYHPGGALAMSGYPVVRFMASPFREATIMRSYADLDRLGDPLLRIVESFTGNAILTKLGVS